MIYMSNNKSAVSFHPQDKSSGSHSTILIEVFDNITSQSLEIISKPESGTEYNYSAIDVDVLGTIYENYLAYMQKGIELVGGKAHRKEQGIYYTPKYIVDYIVKNTIRESLSNLKEDAIKDFKILDLACGSGSFLISVIGELDNYYIKHLDGYKILPASRKLDVIKNNLYGVDLDERAIYIAKLSVYLKLIMLSQRPEGGGNHYYQN